MGYSVTTVDNKEYYSPDVKAIQALLMPVVVMESERDIVEELGMQVDLASNAKKSAQNEAMVKVSGTVQEKKARVEQLTEDKALVEAIYRRAYNSLKVKLEMAEKIYSGLKKSLSKRIAEVDLDRFSKDKYTREPEDPMED